MKKLLPFFIIFFSYHYQLNATSINVSGNIFSNTNWTADTVKIMGDVYTGQGTKLTISSGTIVEFYGFYQIDCRGSIQALGTVNDSIYFTHYDTTGLSDFNIPNGGWRGLNFNSYWGNAPDSTILNYCSIKYVKNNYTLSGSFYGISTNAAIQFTAKSNFRISNCLITNNYLRMSTPTFPDILDWGLISCDNSSSGIITNNTITHNTAGTTVINASNYSDPLIHQNIICYNTCNAHGAISVGQSSPIITNNRLTNNVALIGGCGRYGGGGITVGGNFAHPYIANNLIANNSVAMRGGGLNILEDTQPIIINNTIVNNLSDWEGGGIFILQGAITIQNNIIWGNEGYKNYPFNPIPTEQIYIYPIPSLSFQPDLINCCIENGINAITLPNSTFSGAYTNCISSNPNFISTTSGVGFTFDALAVDWRLQLSSPCINTGTLNNLGNLPSIDLWYNPRIVGASIEIGAYEAPTGGPDGINDFENNSTVSIYPNPANNYFTINYTQDYKRATIAVVNALGQTIENKTFNNSEKIIFNATDFAKGAYFLNIIIDDERMSSKLIIQ